MGAIFSGPKDKAAYYKGQAQKAELQSANAAAAGNDGEAARLKEVAQKAKIAAISNEQLADNANS